MRGRADDHALADRPAPGRAARVVGLVDAVDPRRDAAVGRIDDERRAQVGGQAVAVVPPEVVVGALDVAPGTAVAPVGVPALERGGPELGRLLRGEDGLVAQPGRPLERGQRPEVPDAAEVRRSPRRAGRFVHRRPADGGPPLPDRPVADPHRRAGRRRRRLFRLHLGRRRFDRDGVPSPKCRPSDSARPTRREPQGRPPQGRLRRRRPVLGRRRIRPRRDVPDRRSGGTWESCESSSCHPSAATPGIRSRELGSPPETLHLHVTDVCIVPSVSAWRSRGSGGAPGRRRERGPRPRSRSPRAPGVLVGSFRLHPVALAGGGTVARGPPARRSWVPTEPKVTVGGRGQWKQRSRPGAHRRSDHVEPDRRSSATREVT